MTSYSSCGLFDGDGGYLILTVTCHAGTRNYDVTATSSDSCVLRGWVFLTEQRSNEKRNTEKPSDRKKIQWVKKSYNLFKMRRIVYNRLFGIDI